MYSKIFYEDCKFEMPLVYIKKIDKILEKLLDENYVLQSIMHQTDRLKKLIEIRKTLKLEIIGIKSSSK